MIEIKDKDINEEVLEKMLECNSACGDLGKIKKQSRRGIAKINHYLKVLPGINYVLGQWVSHIFSDGITTGTTEGDEKLKSFLFALNDSNATNYSVLKEVVKKAGSFGECGLRLYRDNIYIVEPGTYAPLERTIDGIKTVVGYICSIDGKTLISDRETPVDELFKSDEFGKIEITQTSELQKFFKERGLLLLDKSEFVNLRNDTSKPHGDSPLLKDQARLELLTSTYDRLNYDLDYDGPGRIILRPKDGYIAGDKNEVSTGEIINEASGSRAQRYEKAKAEVKRVSREIKESSSDSVILLSGAFGDKIEHLERVTKATEFFDWIENEGVILAQVIGMSPSLLEMGKLSGNVSMKKIIDSAMLHTIVPVREHYATQFSGLISKVIGVEKIYFGKYILQSSESKNTARTKVANIISLLNSVEKDSTDKLVDDFATMLSNDIHDDTGEIVDLLLDVSDETKGEHK